jgi:CrcB protein
VSVPAVVLVALGAAVGAPLRYVADRAVTRTAGGLLPWGTFAVNVAGSLLLGLLGGLAVGPDTALLLGAGFCGALTTFSTYGYETMRLAQSGSFLLAATNAFASVAAGLGAAALGFWLGRLG